MIRVSITDHWTDGNDGTTGSWEIEVDAAYNPDLADDLARRVTDMRRADRADSFDQVRRDREDRGE